MEITEVASAPSSPQQNPFAERLVGFPRREFLDHVIVLSEAHLRSRVVWMPHLLSSDTAPSDVGQRCVAFHMALAGGHR